MTDWLDDADLDEEPTEVVDLVPTSIPQERPAPLSKIDAEDEHLKAIENRILSDSMAALERVPGWLDLDPEAPEVMPEGWVEEFGIKEATRRHRIAQAALLPPGKAPMALHISRDTVIGILKKRKEEVGNRQLNIQVVQIPISHEALNYGKIYVDD